jgi:hypothetical protein
MGFLSTGLWWALFVPAALSFTVYQIARRNREVLPRKFTEWGMVCSWICLLLVILTFVFCGWKGGLGVIIGATLVALIVVLAIRRRFRRE